MQFRIADTFTDSLAKLTGDEQKVAKTTAFDLQMDPSAPGLSFHKLDRARDKNFWSVRINRDLRLIVHRTAASIMLAYVGHHDAAYRWAERRRLERHPKTGAAQIVEIRETVREIEVPRAVTIEEPAAAPPATKPALFAGASDDELLAYGVPETWLDDVRGADEDSLLDLPTTCRPRRRKRFWSSRPAARRTGRCRRPPARTPSPTQTRNAASAWWRT